MIWWPSLEMEVQSWCKSLKCVKRRRSFGEYVNLDKVQMMLHVFLQLSRTDKPLCCDQRRGEFCSHRAARIFPVADQKITLRGSESWLYFSLSARRCDMTQCPTVLFNVRILSYP